MTSRCWPLVRNLDVNARRDVLVLRVSDRGKFEAFVMGAGPSDRLRLDVRDLLAVGSEMRLIALEACGLVEDGKKPARRAGRPKRAGPC